MSTIYGKYHIQRQTLHQADLIKMQNNLNYWNADDMGIWKNDYIGLGHLMLWNTPESLQEKLPLKSPHSENIITADARIDNRTELFIKLKITDYNIPDSNLILVAYDKWGRDCVLHLEGDFAFIIWDAHREELFCARDHFGVKPLFYHLNNDIFLVSSEIRGFSFFIKNLELNYDHFIKHVGYLSFKHAETSIQNVYEVLPASYLIVNKDELIQHQYWDLDPTYQQPIRKTKDYAEELEFLLKKSVKERLRTAFPIGSELSGGLDSGIVTSMSYQLYDKKEQFHTYSHVLPDHLRTNKHPFVDEREYIEEVINYLNIKNTHFQDEIADNFLELIEMYLDDIFQIPFSLKTTEMIYPNSQTAQKDNVRTLLSGFLGDEGVSFRGGNTAIELFKEKRWGAFSKYVLPYLIKNPSIVTKATFRRLKGISNTFSIRKVRENESFLSDPQLMKQLLDQPDSFSSGNFKNHRYKQYFHLKKMGTLSRFTTESIVAKKHKVEMRYPLASKTLVEYFLSLPIEQKNRNGINRFIFRNILKKWLPSNYVMSKKRKPYSLPAIHFTFMNSIPSLMTFLNTHKNHSLFKELDFDKILLKINNTAKIDEKYGTLHGYERLRYLIMTLIFFKKNQK